MLTLGLLTILPGDAFCRLFFSNLPHPQSFALIDSERLFLRFFSGTLLVGWWALLLAEIGWFSRPTVLLGVLIISGLLYLLGWRRQSCPNLRFRRPQPTVFGVGLAILLIVTAALTLGHPFETMVGSEDAGIYFNTGGLIARTGAIKAIDPGLNEFGDAATNAREEGAARHVLLPSPDRGSADDKRFLFLDWQRMAGFNLIPGEGNTVTPQFFHLLPVWLALWATFGGGLGAMVYTSAVFGLLGVAATTLLARRLFGTATGLLAGVLLAANGLQLWFARQSLTEILLQALLVGGVATWVIFIAANHAAAQQSARGAALLSGFALGSVAFAHAQFLFALLPVAALLAWLWLARRWQASYWWFFLPLVILLVHATVHIAIYSLGYFEGIYHHVWKNALRDWQQTALLFLFPIAVIWLLGWAWLRDSWLPLLMQQRIQALIRWLAVIICGLLGIWLYLLRPGILRPDNLSGLNAYIGAPVPPGAGAALVSLGWYLSPLGMVLVGVGLCLLLLQHFDERSAALLCVTLPFAILYLTGTYTQAGYIYSLRRFVPLVLPLAVILIAAACVHAGPAIAAAQHRPQWRRVGQALGFGAAAVLLLFLGYTNLKLALHQEYLGVFADTKQLAQQIDPNDLLIFSGPRDETPKLATPLNYLFGRESWTITTNLPNGPKLDTWVTAQEAAGRHVHILMSAGGGKLFLPNHRLVAVEQVQIPLIQFEKLNYQKPFNQQHNLLSYTLYKLEPVASGQSALGSLPYQVVAGQGDEFALLSPIGTTPGFYNVEVDPGTPAPQYRWTDGEALLRIPYPGGNQPLTLRLTLSAGPRPADLPPAQVLVGLRPTPGDDDKAQLATLTIGKEWAEYTVTIPANAIAPTADGTALIHLAIPRVPAGKKWDPAPGATWSPAQYPQETNNSGDTRILHIRFAQAELTTGR